MPLPAGTELGTHKILALIGVGGMGEVYKAHDTKLRRDVAIKVLPESFARDADRLARFRREAQLLASLNHPNIATIYNIEDSNNTTYLVMELVPGENLAERVKRGGAVPVEEALIIAKQIAEALEAAHEKGIIHRDLKPANVKLTPEGKVKVLDFGLAKAFAGDTSTEDIGNSPTLSMAATMQGVILGTAAYMSPEQARGKAVGKRTDIWAFGCVLYELLTGKQTFHGVDITDILAAVVRAEPDWQALPAATPVKVRDLLRRCLQKDKTLRLRDAGDAQIEIQEAIAAPKDSGVMQAAPASTSKLPWAVAATLVVVAAVMAFLYFRTSPSAEESVAKFSVLPPPNVTLASEFVPVISPDGKKLAFIARDASGTTMLWVRQIDSLAAQPIAGTDSAHSPFWAPDSSSIAFLYQGTLKRVDLVGGAPRTLCESNLGGQGGTWSSDGVILLGSTLVSGLLRVPSGGGACQAGTELNRERQERSHVFPEFLPDGRHFLYLARSNKRGNTGVMVGSLDSKEAKFVLPCSSQAVYAAPGYLLFVRDQTLMAQRFDTGRLELSGEAFPVVEQIAVSPFGDGMFSVSSNGVLAFRSGTSGNSQLTWFDRSGKSLGSVGPAGAYVNLALSTDGKRVVFQRQNGLGHRDIWQMEIVRPVPQRVTFSASDETNPIYSPDGATIVFASNREGPTQLFEKPSSGVGTEAALVRTDGDSIPIDWSADGHFLIFRMVNKQGVNEGWVLPMTGERKPFGYLQSNDLYQNLPRLSPNGRWLAYFASDVLGKSTDIFLQSFPKPGGKWQVSTGGGISERWSRDGKELFYLASNGELMAVTVKGETAPEIGSPVALFAPLILGGGLSVQGYTNQYDVAPDGRFLIIVPVDEGAGSSMTVVLNWAAGLKK
jgi:eukaryotic-like serine/threonine-protein kinase